MIKKLTSKAFLFAVLPKSSAVATTYLIPGGKKLFWRGVGGKWIKYVSLLECRPFILLLIFRERKRKEMEEEYEKEIMEKEARKR